MDLLSEVLRAVKLQGALFFHGEFSAPWCLHSVGSTGAAPYLAAFTGSSAPARLILYHYLTEGRAYARLADGTRVELAAGDIVILPHGDPHFLGNGSPERPVDSFRAFAKNLTEGLKAAKFGGGGEITRFVCGYIACDPRMGEVILAGLPPILRVNVANEPSGEWLAHSIKFTVSQDDGRSAGSSLMVAKLSEVLFVETLRRYVSTLPAGQTGWLAGAGDRVIGEALALMHRAPEHPWSVPELARRVGLSRTRFAERFGHFLGESPMAYLAQWRLKLAAELLQAGNDTVLNVADAVGYGSEAAFNRAFKREYGIPPAQFRRRKNVGLAVGASSV